MQREGQAKAPDTCLGLAHFPGSQPPQKLYLESEILLSSSQVIGKSTFCSYLVCLLLLGSSVLAADKSVLQCPIQTALPFLLGGTHHTSATTAAVQSQLVEFLKSLKPQFAPRLEGRTSAGAVAYTHHRRIQVATSLVWYFPSLYWENISESWRKSKREKKPKQTTKHQTSTKMQILQVRFAYFCLYLEINTTFTSKASEETCLNCTLSADLTFWRWENCIWIISKKNKIKKKLCFS